MKTFKALSALLCYPSNDLKAATDEIRTALEAEKILSDGARAALEPLLKELETLDIYELQENFVLLFDRTRILSLNLFEHVHGDSRERGPAMVDLLETYRAGGFDLVSTELPDHLPILLEFVSGRPMDEAKTLLADAGHIVAALADRLERRGSSYAAVLNALVEFSQVKKSDELVQQLLSVKEDDPDDLDALDDIWEEAEVTFGPDPNAGCPASRDLLAAMDPGQSKARPQAQPYSQPAAAVAQE
jgi:nitrate reductase delta subunit